MMLSTIIQVALVLSAIAARPAWAFDIFDFQGPRAKLHGGAGLTESRSAASLFYNPANLALEDESNSFIDLAPSRLDYRFTAPNGAGTGKIAIPLAPFVAAGTSLSDSSSGMSFGAILVPTGLNTKTDIKGFPIALGGQYQSADIQNQRSSFKLGFGGAYRVNSELSLGFGLIYDYLRSQSSIRVGGEDYLELANTNRFLIGKFGLRYALTKMIDLGLEYQPESKSWYSLSASAFGGSEVKTFRQQYKPETFGLGINARLTRSIEVFSQYRYEKWVAGTFVEQSPTQTVLGTAPVEFLNAHNIVAGSSYRFRSQHKLVGSISYFTPNRGEGRQSENGETLAYGRGIQDFESLKRYHLTTGWEGKRRASTSTAYLSYIRATAVSSPESPSAGFYELTVYMLGYGHFFN